MADFEVQARAEGPNPWEEQEQLFDERTNIFMELLDSGVCKNRP
jgi:hypothetical protein